MAVFDKLRQVNNPYAAVVLVVYIIAMAFVTCFSMYFQNEFGMLFGGLSLLIGARDAFAMLRPALQNIHFPVMKNDMGVQE